jgi:hypothetical protein
MSSKKNKNYYQQLPTIDYYSKVSEMIWYLNFRLLIRKKALEEVDTLG